VDGIAFQGSLASEQSRADCYGPLAQLTGSRQHFVLRRQGGELSVRGPSGAWRVGTEAGAVCGSAATSVSFAGVLPPLSHLLVGFGGGGFEPGSPYTSGEISNLELRLLDDPDDCPEGTIACDSESGQSTCVDTSQSAEHCGACGARCEAHAICENGRCRCGSQSGLPGITECDGACVDPMTSLDHCGGCGNRCKLVCLAGACDPITGGTCDSPFEIPTEGGELLLALPPLSSPDGYGDYTVFYGCEAGYYDNVQNLFVGTWTPSRSGNAFVDVDVGEPDFESGGVLDSIVGITADPYCGTWLACNDDIVPTQVIGSHLRYPVVAGTTYKVGVEFWSHRPPGASSAKLRIGFER
jgi:hypothetical protein